MRRARLLAIYLAGWLGAAGLASSAGCGTAVSSARTSQPNPMTLHTSEVLRESKHLHIAVRDMEIPRAFRMYQSAWFQVVSRDRLRFHVVLVHKWEEFTDVRGWNARLEDDAGNVYHPEAREARARTHTAQVWDHERRTAQYNLFGDVVAVNNDGYKQRVELDSVDLFKGAGDVVFYSPDLFDRQVKRLTLVLERGGVAYRFTWDLYDPTREGWKEDEQAPPGSPQERMQTHGVEQAGGNAYPR